MASFIPNATKAEFLQALIDDATTMKMMLLTDAYTPDKDAHDFIDDVNANETSGIDYTAGGKGVTNVTTRVDDANDRGELTFDDVVWNSGGATGTLSAAYAVLYDDTGTPGTSRIFGVYELNAGNSLTATNAPFTIEDDPDDGGIGIA